MSSEYNYGRKQSFILRHSNIKRLRKKEKPANEPNKEENKENVVFGNQVNKVISGGWSEHLSGDADRSRTVKKMTIYLYIWQLVRAVLVEQLGQNLD